MSKIKFMVGDKVHLNSNPEIPMTVRKNMSDGSIIVNYFSHGNHKAANYPAEMLTLVKNKN